MKVIRGVNVFPTQVETALLSMGGGVAPHYMMIDDTFCFTFTSLNCFRLYQFYINCYTKCLLQSCCYTVTKSVQLTDLIRKS